MSLATEIQEFAANGSTEFNEAGFQIARGLFSADACDALASELTAQYERQRALSKSRIGGIRNVLRENPQVAAVARSASVLALMEDILGCEAFPVRAIFFDKTPGANWTVPWHQDLTIAVKGRVDTVGFGPWSVKDEVVHVQPPQEILERMATFRLHLDDCGQDNGPLRVIPGSHQLGELSAVEIKNLTGADRIVTCEVSKGGALIMRPLLLHASSSAQLPVHRRVLHVEYAVEALPNGLEWCHS